MSFIEIATKQGEDAVTRIDGQGQVINNILGSVGEISAESLTKVYREGLGSKGEKNEKVSGLVVATMDAVEGTVSLLKQIQTWVVLMIPPVQTGGQFEAEVQRNLVKTLQEWTKGLTDEVDKLPAYFKDRAAGMEKLCASESNSTKTTKTSSENTTTGKESGKEGKEGSSTETVTSSTKNKPLDDAVEYVVMLDVKTTLALKALLLQALRTLIVMQDFVTKNKSMITKPAAASFSASRMY